VLAADAVLAANAEHWFVAETTAMLRRTLARLEVSPRSLFALIEPGSCFAGTLAELAFAADRAYMLDLPDEPERAPRLALSAMNFGPLQAVDGRTRLASRFHDDAATLAALEARTGVRLDPAAALAAGLVTFTPDDLDWDDEIRIAVEERASLSPDALSGLEANLRFPGGETMLTRIFGRLSAWQNWIFHRPNAVGEGGALKRFGSGTKAAFDWKRV
jgi:benzoyl-CoA-dihydrodiol lyase